VNEKPIAKHGVVRIDLHNERNGEIDVVGNAVLEQPRMFCVPVIPELLRERINILKMLSPSEQIENFGRKYNDTLYHIRVSKSEWETIQPFLIKENIYEKKYKLRYTYNINELGEFVYPKKAGAST